MRKLILQATSLIEENGIIIHFVLFSLSPFFVPRILNNLPASNVSIRFGLQGPCVSNNMACASSGYSIIEGLRFVIDDDHH